MTKKYFTLANSITAFRLVLFGFFVWLINQGQITSALIFLGIAWGLDAIDGQIARWLKEDSRLGSYLDKIIDRLILGFGILLLIRYRYLPDSAIFLLSKDIGLLPAFTIGWARRESYGGLGWTGKTLTFLQGAAVIWLLAGWPYPDVAIALVAAAGATAAWHHLREISN